jgi:hypothetical protein
MNDEKLRAHAMDMAKALGDFHSFALPREELIFAS